MLHVTDIRENITIRCSCQCFAVSLRTPKALGDGVVRCLFCASRAALSDLLRDWEIEQADAPIHWAQGRTPWAGRRPIEAPAASPLTHVSCRPACRVV